MIMSVIVIVAAVLSFMCAAVGIGFYDPNETNVPPARNQIICGLLVLGVVLLVVGMQMLYFAGMQAALQ